MHPHNSRAAVAPKSPNDANVSWDKLYSTFYWNIFLDPSHAQNNPRVQIISGYSKKVGQDEAKDKNQLLMRKVHTVAGVNGYLFRSRKIEFFARGGNIINKADDVPVLILFPKTYQLHPSLIKQKYENIHRFLIDFYDCIINGKDLKAILPRHRAEWSKDDYMNIQKLFFSQPHQLDEYCSKLVRNGHPFDAVVNFRRKYIEQKPFTT